MNNPIWILRRHPRLSAMTALLGLLGLFAILVPLAGSRSISPTSAIAVGRVHQRFQPVGGKTFILIIGTDARTGNPLAANGDAIHLVGINTHTMKGGVLDFPRDSWVNIPGHGMGKITSSFADGGPELMAKTIEGITGIHIDYWLVTAFQGFQAAVHSFGTLPLRIPYNIDDRGYSGAYLQAGMRELPAYKVLQYARARHTLPHGDLDRTHHQGEILLALLRKMQKQVGRDPGTLMKWISVAQKYTRLNLAPEDLFRLGVLASQVGAKDIKNLNVPVTLGNAGSASVDFIVDSKARAIYKRFKSNGSL
jgi:LCP family protein required for cell wall assembly